MPKWNTISISGYHMREKGCSAVQEVAFTLSNAIAYVQAAIDAGLEVDEFAPQLAFFFNGHNNVFQEVAKFRAVRKMWAEIMRDRFGAKNARSQMVRFHTQTGGSTLTAQQPENNIVRVALQGFAAVCGGTQSLHTNGFDEALGLPTERSAKIALRTQQVIAEESGAADTRRPVRRLLLRRAPDRGHRARGARADGADRGPRRVRARDRGRLPPARDRGGGVGIPPPDPDQAGRAGGRERVRRGGRRVDVEILKIDPNTEQEQVARLQEFKASRDQEAVARRLQDLREVAEGSGNLLYPLKDALRDRATLGEVCNVMREVFGEYKPPV